jgi:hypothetical protein
MKAEDLRIGNYVYCAYAGYEGKEFIISEVKPNDLHDRTIEKAGGFCPIIEYPDNYRPIPLTEEWLVKCEFEKINHVNGYVFWSLSRSKINRLHLDVYDNYAKYYGYIVAHCKYLHQLQNLYFALNGKELTIK